MSQKIVILGAGGFAREVAWLIKDINRFHYKWDIIGFVDSDQTRLNTIINDIKVLSVKQAALLLPDVYAVAGIGAPKIKERAVNDAIKMGFPFATLIHPSVLFDDTTVKMKEGVVICAGNILTVNIEIGAHAMINLHCTIGHDCIIEEFVTISPGCNISGHTTLKRGVYMGTGSVTVENHEIGSYSVVGAGSVVVKDVPSSTTVVGVPAKILER